MAELIISPAAWRPAELEARNDWQHWLSELEIAEIDAAYRRFAASGKPLLELKKSDFPLPRFTAVAAHALDQLENGAGVYMIRGFPVSRYTVDELRMIYWGLGKYLGVARSQSTEGDVIGDVRDLDVPKDSPRFRGYKTRGGGVYHCDTCDVTGLFVLQVAKAGGLSLVASSVTIHNEIARTRPDLLEVLYQPFIWSMQGQEREGEPQYYPQPVFTQHLGYFSCRYVRPHIAQAQRRFPEVPRLTSVQAEALDLMDSMLASPEYHSATNFQPGDLQLVNNHITVHARTGFEDYEDPARKRHLLRMWLSVHNSRPLSPLLGHIYHDQSPGTSRGGFPPRVPGTVVFETTEM